MVPGYRLPWHQNPAFWALLADMAIAASAITAASIAITARSGSILGPEGALAAITFVGGIVKAALTWRDKAKTRSHQGLEGCLYALNSQLLASAEQGAKPDLRLTIHVPVNGGKELEQALHYVCDDSSRRTGAGRKTPQHCGIIGHAYRNGLPFVASREAEDSEDYVRELKQKWGFSDKQARALDLRAMSFAAVPLSGDDGVEAVLYIDSSKKNYFTGNRHKIIEDACTGIALFINRTYTRGSK